LSSAIKITLYVAFVVSLFLIEDPCIYLPIAVVIAILLLRVPFAVVRKGWVPILFFLAFTFAGNAMAPHGRILFNIGSFVVTQEGLTIAGLRTARVFFMILGAKILTATTTTKSLVGALGKMLKPLERVGLPVEEFFSVVGLSVKSLPRIKSRLGEAYEERMRTAHAKGFWNRTRLVSLFLIPLFVKSMQRPERFFEDKPDKKEIKSSSADV
jgi:energy-coupling factor transport system permease protein